MEVSGRWCPRGRLQLLNSLLSHPSRSYYWKAFLIYLGFFLNTFTYFFYSFVFFRFFDNVIDYYLDVFQIKIHFEQKEILFGIVATYVIYLWIKLFAQGFDGDAFSHIMYWRYRLINKGEMIARLFGGLTSGVLFGIVSSNMLDPEIPKHAGYTKEEFVASAFNGCTKSRTIMEILLQPVFSLRIARRAHKLPFLGDASVPFIYMTDEYTLINRYIVIILENFVFEFSFSLAIYMALSHYMVARHGGHFTGIYILFKRFAAFTANSYLRNIHGVLSLDASIAIRRYFQDENFHLLIVRVLANLLAALIASFHFNPLKALPYNKFKEVFVNVKTSKLEAIAPKGMKDGLVYPFNIEDDDLDFTPFPNTFLGRLFRSCSSPEEHAKTD
ncbi:hypothetical protein BgAZ_103100 [Babesia gibsoni]|uniref:Uncharacterized protein n=1 Tax=Babesia gibsoni TaxID=33632 RepID=A0AAD8UVK9_BABGI|nr:hypothetical protein BgAZ_103100 [Babesia gibsoni]